MKTYMYLNGIFRNWSYAFAVLLLCTATVSAKTWYVSLDGSDDVAGDTPETAFANLAKARSSAEEGDTIRLRRGDIFRESASLSDRVSLGAYGDSELLPVVSGAELIEGFSPVDGNSTIFRVKAYHEIQNLFVNGRLMRIARYPNSGWLRTTANNSTSTVVTCSALASHPRNSADYWKGCRMRWRFWSWFFDTRLITGYDADGTMHLAGEPSEGSGNGESGWGFYLDGKREELDTAGEWFFDIEDSTVYLFPPDGVDLSAAVVEGMWRTTGVSVSNATVDGVWFRHFAQSGLEVTRNSAIDNCRFSGIGSDSGGAALSVTWDASGVTVRDCRFEECLNLAISWVQNPATKTASYIERNSFVNIGSVPGYGGNGPWHAAGIILSVGGGIHVQHNMFDTTGYAAILLGSAGNFAEYNIIRHAMYTLNDGAGIYTNCDSSTIRKNIIMYGGGGFESTGWEIRLAHGIWPEFLGHYKNNIIDSNTCAYNNGNGIFFPNNFNSLVRGNVCFGNLSDAQMYMEGGFYTDDNLPLHDTIVGNVFCAMHADGVALSYRPDYDYGIIKGNWYCNPFSSNLISEQIEWNSTAHTLDWWKENWDQYDTEAKTAPILPEPDAPEDDPRGLPKLLVNTEDELRTVTIGDKGVYCTLDGTEVSGSLAISPYYSAVIVHTGEQATVRSGFGDKAVPVFCSFVTAGAPRFMLRLPRESVVSLRLTTLDGRTAYMVSSVKYDAGMHRIICPSTFAAGCYVYRLSAIPNTGSPFVQSGRVVLWK